MHARLLVAALGLASVGCHAAPTCTLRLEAPRAFVLPNEAARLPPSSISTHSGPFTFGLGPEPRWGVDPREPSRAFRIEPDVEREEWTPTHRVHNTYGSIGVNAPTLRISERDASHAWRNVSGADGLFAIFGAFDWQHDAVAVVGHSAREPYGNPIDYVLVDAAGRAGPQRPLLRGQPPERMRMASNADDTLAVAWVQPLRANAPDERRGCSLWLGHFDLERGAFVSPPRQLDVDPVLDADSASLALAVDGGGAAVAWGPYSKRRRVDADDRPLQLRVFRQRGPAATPVLSWSTEVSTRAIHADYSKVERPTPLAALTLDGRAVFDWVDSTGRHLALADGGSTLLLPVRPSERADLQSLAADDTRLFRWNWDTNTHATSRLRCD